MPKCGHTLRRDVTANLLSTILSLWLFHYKLGTRFNFSTRDVCFSDHHTSTLSLTLAEWVCPLRETMVLFTALLPTLKKHLAPDPELIFFPLLKVLALPLIKNWLANRNTIFTEYATATKDSCPNGNFSGGM